jgi:transcriptional regulator with XRE-family HTH domain
MEISIQSQVNSSDRLISFLDDTGLHKKDFAEMIGVTLSYVYSLINREIPFSTRSTTLERIAVVMGVEPESFPEYKRAEEPRIRDTGIEFLKSRQKELGLSNVQFLKQFPRQQRVEIVDMWRGSLPMPLDWAQLMSVAKVMELSPKDIYPFWQHRMFHYLCNGGIDPVANADMLNSLFDCMKAQLGIPASAS